MSSGGLCPPNGGGGGKKGGGYFRGRGMGEVPNEGTSTVRRNPKG